jgi:glycosyltransferase involved in cell wall biosynthesis
VGGLGLQVSSALNGLAGVWDRCLAFGPTPAGSAADGRVEPHPSPTLLPGWVKAYTPLRWWTGWRQYLEDRHRGRWAAARVQACRPDACYVFTQVGLETLRWAQANGVPTVLDSPNGHIRGFAEVYSREAAKLAGATYRGHPTEAMVRRVEAEYALAGRIRVSSAWARDSLVRGGVSAEKVVVIPQPLDLDHFRPAPEPHRPTPAGPLRVCFVGSLDFRKGFVYLLRALRALGPGVAEAVFVGGTGDRLCRKLWQTEAAGLAVRQQPGDPVPVYWGSDLFVLPSLEDGFGFVVAEAMACGVPAVVTDQCGAAELIDRGKTGWILPAGDVTALVGALREAARNRTALAEMGRRARAAALARLTANTAEVFAARLFPRTRLGPRVEGPHTTRTG